MQTCTSDMCCIAAVVATHNRPKLLANRALESIARQSRPPDYLVVVDDSDPKTRHINEQVVADFRADGTRTVYLENYRTAGAAGAWNTALSWLQGIEPSAFVAILDDDDAWAPTYLESCERMALEERLDMVAAGIIYHKSFEHAGWPLTVPDRLDVEDLLVRNPHIQGSNLFVRLRKLLEAGCFDEALASTTDRDICIRLADLGSVTYGALAKHLVHHYAEDDRTRLSTRGGDAKCAGLRQFYRKYRSRMTGDQRSAFIERSRDRFDCDPTPAASVLPPTGPNPYPRQHAGGHLDLVVGAITSPEVDNVARLLDGLITKLGRRNDIALEVLLLENGLRDPAPRVELKGIVTGASRRGLDIEVKTLEQQDADVEAGVFAVASDRLPERKSIALARTMLQHYLFLKAKPRQGAVVWILDDDIVLEGLGYGGDGSLEAFEIDYVSAIKRLKETGACVVLGEVVGDPPLPFLSCIRTQLVDLYHNLGHLAALDPKDWYPDQTDENRLSRLSRRDYYYDLSRTETDRLESPFWYEASQDGMRVERVFDEMMSRLPAMLSGSQIFRPLVQTVRDDPVPGLVPSVNRGPSTLVFDVQALREFPNAVPTIGGADVRRGDMVWSLLNRFVGGCKIVQAPLPVRQVRRAIPDARPDFHTLAQDIRGYALYSSLHDVLLEKAQERQRAGQPLYSRRLLAFDDHQIERAVRLYVKYVRERSLAFELSFLRVMGIISALRRFYSRDDSDGTAAWWIESPEHQASVARARRFVEVLESIYTDEQLDAFTQGLVETDIVQVERYLRTLPETAARYRSNTPLPREELEEAAERYVRAQFGTGPLTCLGIGEEGVSLTDGRLVYKYFHYWKSRNRERRISFLQSLCGKLSGYTTLPDIRSVHRNGDYVVAVYPYETGARYEGGHLDQILTLLRECRDAGLACRNVHPDNLLMTPSGLRLIDFGSDIVPLDEDDFEQMCRRGFLTYRFHFWSDLKRLMTRALSDATLPELMGFEHFMNALDPRGLDELFYRPILRFILQRQPESALDYGTGTGQLAERLSDAGVKVTAYDPDTVIIERRRGYGCSVEYGSGELLRGLIASPTRFDAVVCSRVLCTISDRGEFDNALRNLRRLVADSGTVMVAVCNPFHLEAVSTELAVKDLPATYEYESTFSYTKTVASTGNRRTEVHRSLAEYRRAFTKAGLKVNGVVELEGADTRSLRPASDHLVFRLSPSPEPAPRVSLLIKTCLMEWKYIERLVRHQVGQLEWPVGFVEKIVVVDPSEGPFSRQYEQADADAHRAVMNRLIEDGVVDRVVYAPQEPAIVRRTYRKWFGVESEESHSIEGQQLFATLYGFDCCAGDYVLHLDSDMLILRSSENHNYLAEMVDVFRRDPGALFVPLSICRSGRLPYTSEGPNGDWRVEVRGCMFDRQRLQSVLPVPNALEDGRFSKTWHRAFDRMIASGDYRSYRGGDPRTASIHVPNDRKSDMTDLLEIVEAVERGFVPSCQMGSTDLVGSSRDWAGPKRGEPFVFVICGRNVVAGKFRQCFESLVAQDLDIWGAIVVDDASTNGFGDYAEMLAADYAEKVTLVRNKTRQGSLYNLWNAVTRFCTDPETVILTLDADDALAGRHVLSRVRAEYDDAADLTAGSMLRLDKEVDYPVDFKEPRSWDSNVWQHLRTFKKYLFDAIDVEDLKLDGEWIDLANDWAFMAPMAEMARSPRHIPEPLYIYEPAEAKRRDRRHRDAAIARILAKPKYAKLRR